MSENVKIRFSAGLLVVALVHGLVLGAVFASLHGVKPAAEASTVWRPPVADTVSPLSPSLQALPQPAEVNLRAQGEVKQAGAPVCLPCQLPKLNPGETLLSVGPARVINAPGAPVRSPSASAAALPPKRSYQLALFLDGSPRSRMIDEWFRTDPQLSKLRSKVDFQIYTSSNAIYRSRFADVVPVDQFPVVLLQDATGGHVHAAGASMIPSTAGELYSDLKEGFSLYGQAKNGVIESTGAIKTLGYSWDQTINPGLRLSADCPDGNCPSPSDSWKPGDRVRDVLFDRVGSGADSVATAFIWANATEIVTIAMVALVGSLLLFVAYRKLS